MFQTVVIATDGSESAGRAVRMALNLADRFDAAAHALYVVATGTRGRHGDHAFLLGSVAEAVVRRCPVPVLTVRQLGEDEHETDTTRF